MCGWLRSEAGARLITATSVKAANYPSRRVLEKLGFVQTRDDDGEVSYRLADPDDG